MQNGHWPIHLTTLQCVRQADISRQDDPSVAQEIGAKNIGFCGTGNSGKK